MVEMKISHEEFNAIFKEKDKYEAMKNMRQWDNIWTIKNKIYNIEKFELKKLD